MSIKVIQRATGGVGRSALRHIIADPELDLAGVYVYSKDKDGLDAATLAGLDPVGVTATSDRDAILALDADCVLHAPLIFTDRPVLAEMDDDVDALLRSGKNVISVAGYIWPAARGEHIETRLAEACRAGNATLYGTGINPGYLLNHLGPAATALCQRVSHLSLREIWDATHYPSPELLFAMVGFGQPADWLTLDAPAGLMLAGWFNEALASTVHALGGEVERFERSFEYGLAARDITMEAGSIAEGTIGAVGWTWSAIVEGKPLVSITDRWIADWDIPGWSGARAHHWHIEITGEPSMRIRMDFDDTTPHCAASARAPTRTASLPEPRLRSP